MQRFKNILVGVDLSEDDRFVSDCPAPPSEAAIERAIWLAKANSARLLFMHVMDTSSIVMPAQFGGIETWEEKAAEVLQQQIEKAKHEGVKAESKVIIGKSWLELIRQVLRDEHDLLIAGTRHMGVVRSILFGSTGMKLLRLCPCPVWLTEPSPEKITSVLVAHDLQPVGDLAMELGCSMAERQGSQLHVFHAIRYPEMEKALPSRVTADKVQEYRSQAEEHINQQLKKHALAKPAEVHLETGDASAQIVKLIERYKVDLLVMGTVARSGIAGFFTGNTAERLLPHVPCSVIAVKPTGFQTPVSLD